MRLLIASLCIILLGCTPATQKLSSKQKKKSQALFTAMAGEGDYKSRYENIYNTPAPRLCEAMMPMQSIDWTFVPMLEPGVIRWIYKAKEVSFGRRTNAGIGYLRLYDLLTDETRKCTKARNRTSIVPEGAPWEDRVCGPVAVKAVCGSTFVSYENYERLIELSEEMKKYQKMLRGPIRADNEINCSGYSIGGSTRMRCR